jgi:hypothetical protein
MAEQQGNSQPILEPIDWWWQGATSVHDGIFAGMKSVNAGNESALQALGLGSAIFGSVFLGGTIFIGGVTNGFNGAAKNGVAGVFSLWGAELGFAAGSILGPAGSVVGTVGGALLAFAGGVGFNFLGAAIP